jgi:UDP-glucuronate 4-epimerase
MRILVTGGAGFIGSHLCERLTDLGHDVICVDNFNDYYDPQLKKENIKGMRMKVHRSDIRDFKAMERIFMKDKPEKIVHLAAMAGVRPSIAQPGLYNDVNVNGTLNLLELAKKHRIGHFVFGSSSSVYGMNTKVPFSEDDPTDNIISPYAATKRIGEHYCKVYSSLHGMDITCLRFFTVYGPRCRPDLAAMKFMRLIDEGKPIEFYGDGSTMRDYTYVADIVDGVVASCDKRFRYEIINLGDSKPVKLKDMLATIEDAIGKKAKLIRKPIPPGDVLATYADIRKAGKLLGYKPRFPFRKGIAEMAAWYRRSR